MGNCDQHGEWSFLDACPQCEERVVVDLPIFNITREEARKIMDENPPTVADVRAFHINMTWSWKACGFGELWIRFDQDTGKYSFDHECMGKESVRKFLHALADHVTDNLEIT